MLATMTTTMQLMDVLTRSGSNGCLLEVLDRQCPDLTWNQIFLELDRLSQTGEIRLRRRGAGEYVITATTREGGSRITTDTLTVERNP
jgi:hypothetical protein